MYFAGESEADELLDEPQEVRMKDERNKRVRKRFISLNYSRKNYLSEEPASDSPNPVLVKILHAKRSSFFFDTITL